MMRTILWGIAGALTLGVIYMLFFYSPYSDEALAENRALAEACDRDAIYFLADYYEKRNEGGDYMSLMLLAARCGDKHAQEFVQSHGGVK